PDATYLVTGGLTGIGLEAARSMVQAGARRLVLLGRTDLGARDTWADAEPGGARAGRIAAVRSLERAGAAVLTAPVDVADEAAVRAYVDRFDREGWPPIRGVVHSAAVAELVAVGDLTADGIAHQLHAKVGGAWVLHRVLGDRDLDFFVLFGSGSSVLSSPFMSVYAAANASVDALVALRRGQGRPATGIAWGLWRGAGMAERDEATTDGAPVAVSGALRHQLNLSAGMGALTPAQGVAVFHHLLAADAGHVVVLPVDLPAWGARYREASGSPLLDNVLAGASDLSEASGAAGGPVGRRPRRTSTLPTRDDLRALADADRLPRLTGALHESLASWLGAAPAEVDPDQPLLELGFDSLMAVEMRNEIEQRLGVFVPVSAFLADASVRTVSRRVLGLVVEPDPASGGGGPVLRPLAAVPDGPSSADLLGRVAAMSDVEVRAALEGDR
ncbi:MAG TPA: beta-ketoacyl reductase, partial [Cellulomonas sp.]